MTDVKGTKILCLLWADCHYENKTEMNQWDFCYYRRIYITLGTSKVGCNCMFSFTTLTYATNFKIAQLVYVV